MASVKIKHILLISSLIVTSILALTAAGYFAYRYKKLSDAQPARSDELLIAEISQHVALPPETPTIARVTDSSKLAKQPLFADAQNGDVVLIYATAGKAYLYRPETKKLIGIGPVQTTAPSTDPEPAEFVTPSPSSSASPKATAKKQ